MDIELLGSFIVAALGVTGIILQAISWAGVGRRRRLIKFDAELANSLPENSPGREKLSAHINARVIRLVEYEAEHRRSWSSITIGLLGLGGLTVNLVRRLVDPRFPAIAGPDWPWVMAFLGLVTITGLALGAPKFRRNEDGLPIIRLRR